MKRKILILAKSVKNSNYCIAGIDLEKGEFIRLISRYRSINNAVPRFLVRDIDVYDIVKVDMEDKLITKSQKENNYYKEYSVWEKTGDIKDLNINFLEDYISNCSKIFFNTDRKVTEDDLTGESLLLVNVKEPSIIVEKKSIRKKLKLNFKYRGENYSSISICDPLIYKDYITKPCGSYLMSGERIILFSLTDRYQDGMYYKIAASFL